MAGALRRRGLPEEHIPYVVDGLLEASLRGIDTHGVRLFATYLAELDGGRSRARPELRWSGERAARTLDAGGALGLVAGRLAADEAVRLAREFGAGAVSVGSSNHFGAASVYTLAMARSGALGLAFTNSDALVAPHGGVRPAFGTNPVSMAVRGEGDDLFCADFATSQVSYSKVRHHRAHGLPLEPGWVVEGGEEALKPLGGHKGQCLGMMVEILCALLAGMPLDAELSHLYAPPYDEPRRVAHLFIALDVEAFRPLASFRADLSRFLSQVRAAPAAAGERVLAPGDLEAESAAERRAEGIPLEDEEWSFFEGLTD
jgi:LDH2 family malate/lactate/ureidoglycolate dehydrogenase